MISKYLDWLKIFSVLVMLIMIIWYIIKTSSIHLVNIRLMNSLVLFINDLQPNNNIIEYLVTLILKLIFNIDIHDLESFFKNINPLIT